MTITMHGSTRVMAFDPLIGRFHHPISQLDREAFVITFAGIYEHSAWVAEQAWDRISADISAYEQRELLALVFYDIVEKASDQVKLDLLRAHPDLAGKAALAGEVTQASTKEQAGAGLDQCTEAELARFTRYNEAYKARYGFPFIMAVKGATKETILQGFELRLLNSKKEEFSMALHQVHQIARFRLAEK